MKRLLPLIAFFSTLLPTSCRNEKQEQETGAFAAPEVEILEATPSQAVTSVRIPGRMEPYLQAEVRARVTGIVLDRFYREGQLVKEGDLLFKIDSAPLQAAVDACKADVSRSEAVLKDACDKLAKYSILVTGGGISKREYNLALAGKEQAEAEYNAAEAKLEQAMQELGYATVTSPINGRVRRALVTKGALCNKNELTHLTTVEQIDPIYVRFSAPSSELSKSRRSILSGEAEGIPFDQIKVKLILPDGREYPHEGKLFFSDMAVDPQTDTVEMRAEFPTSDLELLPGAYVRSGFATAIQRNIYRIPRDAVMRTAQSAMVYIIGPGNKLEARPVETERLDGKNWIVTKGLKPGDKIVVSKTSRLMPGMPVSIAAPAAPEAGQNTAGH